MHGMPRDYSITVRWTKGSDIQHGTYEISGELPDVPEQAYEKAIGEGMTSSIPSGSRSARFRDHHSEYRGSLGNDQRRQVADSRWVHALRRRTPRTSPAVGCAGMADPASSATDPLQAVRDSYEGSLSWRVTAPLRAARRRLGAPASEAAPVTALTPSADDLWLLSFFDEQLAPIERELVTAGPDAAPDRSLFRGLPDAVWGMLLTQRQRVYPAIAAALPRLPVAELQQLWNGTSGPELIAQTTAFYQLLKRAHAEHGTGTPLERARVLDFGCGWGRLTRFLERDVVDRGSLCGVDPVQGILDEAVRNGVRAELRRCEFVPERLPFEQSFDLGCAFSVFTHLSEAAHLAVAARAARRHCPGRPARRDDPPAGVSARQPVVAAGPGVAGSYRAARLREPQYLYAPHPSLPLQTPGAQIGEEVSYGETVVTIAYVRERWSERFELVAADLSLSDPHQVALILRRR